jgi:hypothetical protein
MALRAQEAHPGGATPAAGEVRKVGENQNIVGGVTLRMSTGEVSFDSTVRCWMDSGSCSWKLKPSATTKILNNG